MTILATTYRDSNTTGNLLDVAAGRWLEILSSLAPELSDAISKFNPRSPGHVACPCHGGSNGFRLFRDAEETGGGICNTCGPFPNGFMLLAWIMNARKGPLSATYEAKKDYIHQAFAREEVSKYLKHGSSEYPSVLNRIPAKQADEAAERARQEKVMAYGQEVWRGSVSEHELIRRYFTCRGQGDAEVSGLLHFAPHLRHNEAFITYHPAMIAPIVNLFKQENGETSRLVVGLHRTYLSDDGVTVKKANLVDIDGKPANKRVLIWGDMRGAHIPLYELGTSGVLAVCEGIETAEAIRSMLGSTPVYPLINTSGMRGFNIPDGVKLLLIGGDYDRNSAGQKAAAALKERAEKAGVEVRILLPDFMPMGALGTDWEDALIKFPDEAARIWAPWANLEVGPEI